MRELRETMIRLLKEPGQALCIECVATALGQRVSVVMMMMLGLHGRVASVEGVCCACHRRARVIMLSV